jgi:hypothetical protein
MTYAEEVEHLAHALAHILANQDLVDRDDASAVLAARDTVVQRLRALSGAVINAGPAREVFPARHMAADPAHALHAALRDLALASGPDRPPTIDVLRRNGRGALPYWQLAVRASALLEPYGEAVRHLPGPAAWRAALDIADLATTLPHIDADLARHLSSGDSRRWATLTDIGTHGAIRIAADELRARAQENAATTLDIKPSTPARAIRVQSMSVLAEGFRRLTAILTARATALTATEARAVAKALAEAVEVSAHTLRAAALSNPHYPVVAQALDRALPVIRRIYLEPMETLGLPAIAVTRLIGEIRHELLVLRALVDRLETQDQGPRRAAVTRVAAAALAVAREIAPTTAALDTALRAAHDARQLLSPVEYQDGPATSLYLWVRAQPPERNVEPLALAASGAARTAMATIAPMLETAGSPGVLDGRHNTADRAAKAIGEIHAAAAKRGRPHAGSSAPDHPRQRVGSSRRELPISDERSKPRQGRRR